MISIRTISACTALLAAPLASQASYVSPPHAVGVEGNSSSGVTFTNASTRTMQADANLQNAKLPILRSMSFRRNAGAQTTATSRMVDVQIDMGFKAATFTNTFDSNYAAMTRRTVFTKKNISLPDWTAAPPTPADFDLTIKFDTPFVNDVTKTVLWDVMCTNNTGGGTYSMDWMSAAPSITRGERPSELGTGCTTPNGTFAFTFTTEADATNITLRYGFTNAASSTPALAIVGSMDPNVNAGLCANLRADLLFLIPIGASDASGTLSVNSQIPWSASLAGLQLFAQGLSVDPSQTGLPIALSNGIRTTTPYVIGGTTASTAFKIDRLWTNSGQGPTGTRSTTCAPVKWSL